jgi:hypothetical protein
MVSTPFFHQPINSNPTNPLNLDNALLVSNQPMINKPSYPDTISRYPDGTILLATFRQQLTHLQLTHLDMNQLDKNNRPTTNCEPNTGPRSATGHVTQHHRGMTRDLCRNRALNGLDWVPPAEMPLCGKDRVMQSTTAHLSTAPSAQSLPQIKQSSRTFSHYHDLQLTNCN